VASTPDQHPVQALLPHGSYPPLSEGVGVRRLDWCLDDLEAIGGKDVVEGAGELAVAIANEELRCAGSRCPLCFPTHRELSCSLDDPRPVRMVGDTHESNPPGIELDGEQDVEVLRRTVSTVKKSTATMPEACARRKARQVTEARRGAGRSPLPSSTVGMVVADTDIPSFLSSP
jgi:hypothetical protein